MTLLQQLATVDSPVINDLLTGLSTSADWNNQPSWNNPPGGPFDNAPTWDNATVNPWDDWHNGPSWPDRPR